MVRTLSRTLFGQMADAVLGGGAKRATKYLSEKLTAKATYQGPRHTRASRSTVLFTVGMPNYAERQFIKACKRAGEPFPVRKLQVTF